MYVYDNYHRFRIMEVHQKVDYIGPHGPPVLNEHYVPRTLEQAEHYAPRSAEQTEHYVQNSHEKTEHYNPRTSEQPMHYSTRSSEKTSHYGSVKLEKNDHYSSTPTDESGYMSRTPDQVEHYMPRAPTHYIVRPTYYPAPPNGEESSVIVLHPLIIGKDVVLCMPEVNKVLRHVYQVLSQANYYLSKHGISSRRYTGAQLIRIKMLGILGHEAKVCSYILLKDAERVFDSFDVSGDCHKSQNIQWMDPVLLDEKPIPEIVRKSPDLSPREPVHEGPVTVHLFKLHDNIIICAPDVQKVVQANFHQGATVGYYFTKLGIVPHKFLHTSHLDKVKELGIIKRSAVHCTYIMKSDAMCVFEAYGMDAGQVKEKVIFSDVIELGEGTSKSWKPFNMNVKKENSPSMIRSESRNSINSSPKGSSPKDKCFQLNGIVDSRQHSPKNSISHMESPKIIHTVSPTGAYPPVPDDDEERKLMPPDISHDMTVNVFIVEEEEVVCMPDIHKIVQLIHGNSIQVNYYFNKLGVSKKRFCFAHLRELKSRGILQNNATYCTYVPKLDAEKLFQIYCLVDDPKLKEIVWTDPINLDVKLSDDSIRSSCDAGNTDTEDVTIHTFKLEDNVVITVPDVHKIVDFLDEQSASLDYHFRKLGITKCRFTYSQLHQLRRLNVIKRPTVCTYVTRPDIDKLLGMYETERNKHKMDRLKFLEPITLVPGTVVNNKQKHEPSPPVGFDEFNESSDSLVDRSQYFPPESTNFTKPLAPSEMMSPNSAAISYIQNAHPTIDCPIVIPNGDYDPTKVNDDEQRSSRFNDISMNGKRHYGDHHDALFHPKKMKYSHNPTYQGFINDINRKEDELRFLHDAYQREIEEERAKRIALEIKYDEIRGQLHQINELKNKLSLKESELSKCKDELKNERALREQLELRLKKMTEEMNSERQPREQRESINRQDSHSLHERYSVTDGESKLGFALNSSESSLSDSDSSSPDDDLQGNLYQEDNSLEDNSLADSNMYSSTVNTATQRNSCHKQCCWGNCKTDGRYMEKVPEGTFLISFPKPGKIKECMAQWEINQENERTEKAKRWVELCSRENFSINDITRNTYICSLHFIGGYGPTEKYPDPVSASMSGHRKAKRYQIKIHKTY